MAIDVLQFMDKQNAYVLADALLAKTNIRLSERIVKELDANSSNKQLPSARLAYKLISSLQNIDAEETSRTDVQDSLINKHAADIKVLQDSQPGQDEKLVNIETKLSETATLSEELTHFNIETVTGNITTVVDPKTDVMYLQRDSESDKTWMIYLYIKSVNPNYVEYDPSKYFTTDGAGTITGLTADGLAASELIIPKEINGVTITSIADNAFDTASVTNVKFMGTEDEWGNITIGTTGNDALVNATKEYSYELAPETIDSWVNIGDTEVDLSVIWSKDETEELKEALGIHYTEAIPEDRISAIIDAEFDATAVDFRVYKMIENKPSTTNTSLPYSGFDQNPIWDNYDATQVDVSGDVSATDLGDYSTTFTPKDGYKWSDNTADPVSIQWSIVKVVLDMPVISTTLTYTGDEVNSISSGFDPNTMDISGDSFATDPGEYTYTLSLIDTTNYVWSNGSTDPVQVSWSIVNLSDYLSDDGAGTITGMSAEGKAIKGTLIIPDQINGVATTAIADDAFEACDNLTNVIIPASVTSIGNGAFANCNKLIEIEIPVGVTSIGDNTFYNCTSMNTVIIPNGVTAIGNSAFEGCIELDNITIPESLTNIGESAFRDCTSLANVKIPANITNISASTFHGCTKLTNVNIPNGVTNIDTSTFQGCEYLKAITIPASVTNIGESAFAESGVIKVNYTGTEEQWNAITIGSDNDPLVNAVKVYNYTAE